MTSTSGAAAVALARRLLDTVDPSPSLAQLVEAVGLSPSHLGMSPGAYRRGGRGEEIKFVLAETPIGLMLLAATAKGICALRFGDGEGDRERLPAELRGEFPKATLVEDGGALDGHVRAVIAHLAGDCRRLDLPTDLSPTAFQRRVWTALQAIPYGETRSYSDVARMIGSPAAVRAVAGACAANPVALLVPCHRVVRADGGLSGYRWGVERKRRLLEQEKP